MSRVVDQGLRPCLRFLSLCFVFSQVNMCMKFGTCPRSVVHVVDRALLPYYRTVLDVTSARTDLNTFVQAVVAEGTYTSVATGETPFDGTIFAPTDE